MSTPSLENRFGEVVETSVERLIGQCHQLYEAPPLGSLVRAGSDVYAVVSGIATSALDPSRRVIARGANAESEADVYAANPQLERLLRTDVTLTVVGHCVPGEALHQYLPPQPPRIHTFLYACDAQETRAFFAGTGEPRLDFVSLLLAGGTNTDDVVAASLRQAATAFDDPRSFLLAASKAVAVLLSGDTLRLNAIVRRLPINEARP